MMQLVIGGNSHSKSYLEIKNGLDMFFPHILPFFIFVKRLERLKK